MTVLYGMKVSTEFVYPPVPIRKWDWCATLDGYEPGDPIAYAATERDAILALALEIEELEDR